VVHTAPGVELRPGAPAFAHEAAHVAQQQLAGMGKPSSPRARAEAEAEGVASAVARRQPPPPIVEAFLGPLDQPQAVAPAAQAPSETEPASEPAWILPPGVRPGSVPVYDDESRAVIAFRYGGSYWEVYDLDGRVIEVGERGLEQPLIDPIDILAGGVAGLGRGLFGAGARAAARGTAARVGAEVAEEAGVVAARGGLRAAASLLTREALAAARAAWRAIRFRGPLNFTETTARHMAESGRFVPVHILRLAIRYGSRSADPQGVAGAFRYVIPMFRGVRDAAGKWVYRQYTLEVVLREADQTILHYLYR
jgi:hypothetical protein